MYGLLWSEKSSGSDTSKAPTQGPEIYRVEFFGQFTPPVKIQFSCIWSSMKRYVIGLSLQYPGAWDFQGGSKGTFYIQCLNIVMLSCLVLEIRPPFPPFSCIFSHIFSYETKRHQGQEHRRPLPRGLKFSGWVKGDNLRRCLAPRCRLHLSIPKING